VATKSRRPGGDLRRLQLAETDTEVGDQTTFPLAILADRLFKGGQFRRALYHYRKVVQLGCRHLAVWNNYAYVALFCGQPEEAVSRLDLPIGSPLTPFFSTLLCSRLYLKSSTALSLFQAHTSFRGPAVSELFLPSTTRSRSDGPLHIGYLSASIREHSITWFLLPVLENHNRNTFRVFCYSSGRRSDRWTAIARRSCDVWREIGSLSDEEAGSLIRSDEIDILIDLDGHFAGNRLSLLQRKPAPILATYLGYPCTTGLKEIDYRITDAIADPPGGADQCHTEKLARLPTGFLCFRRPAAIGPLRSVESLIWGGPVFCCFATLSKINDESLDLWHQILGQIRDSRLILKAAALADQETRKHLRRRLRRLGFNRHQVDFWPFTARRQDHLASFRQVDIALDTYPYNGTTGTCEALWMGVPVVTLRGQEHRSRVGASILTTVGRTEWIAEDRQHYVQTAIQLAERIAVVRNDRNRLRCDFKNSPLCDAPLFVAGLEQMYRGWIAAR
jgi:protein O-GlcNAc transferase